MTCGADYSFFRPTVSLSAGRIHVCRGRLPENDGVEIGAAGLIAAIIECGPCEINWRAAHETRPRPHLLLPYSALVSPAGARGFVSWRGAPTILAIAINGRIRRPDARPPQSQRAVFGVRDHRIFDLSSKIRRELILGGPQGARYVKSLGLEFAAHISRLSEGEEPRRAPTGGLGARRFRKVIDHIEAEIGEKAALSDLARIARLSPHHFASAFLASAGVSPMRYVMERRIAEACALLEKTDDSVTAIAHGLGFSSHGHFSSSFRRYLRLTPSQFRAGARRR